MGVDRDAEILKEVRNAFPDIDIIVDANSAYQSVNEAFKVAKICDKYDILWLEEPIPTDNCGKSRLFNINGNSA